ncbi:hypothetical protein [Endozoicomonas sp. ALB032]|uniref:hypothetical protein n=1 Tax=Endozoicomonas sp. ALB032 TaxID=3403082 RepID=UPI003BB7FDA4
MGISKAKVSDVALFQSINKTARQAADGTALPIVIAGEWVGIIANGLIVFSDNNIRCLLIGTVQWIVGMSANLAQVFCIINLYGC